MVHTMWVFAQNRTAPHRIVEIFTKLMEISQKPHRNLFQIAPGSELIALFKEQAKILE